MLNVLSERRKAYALRRMSKAVDRVILGDDKARAWVNVWAVLAGIKVSTGLNVNDT